MLMVDADSDEKPCYTDHETHTSKCEIVENLIRSESIRHLDISDSSEIEDDFERGRHPEYLAMDTIDQDKEKYIYKWKKCHTPSIINNREFTMNNT